MGISPKKNRLRVAYGKNERPVEPHRPSGQDTKTTASDWISASRFAKGDARLTSMLRSEDAQQIALAVDEILDGEEYGLRESKWKKKIIVANVEEMPGAVGRKEWDCNITIRKDNIGNLKTYIHENLHSRSASHCSKAVFYRNRALEEGTVEYLSQQICARAGVAFGQAYPEYVNALRDLKSILFYTESEYDFAKRMFDLPEDKRYTYIANEANRYRVENPKMRLAVRRRIRESLAVLSGRDKEATTYG